MTPRAGDVPPEPQKTQYHHYAAQNQNNPGIGVSCRNHPAAGRHRPRVVGLDGQSSAASVLPSPQSARDARHPDPDADSRPAVLFRDMPDGRIPGRDNPAAPFHRRKPEQKADIQDEKAQGRGQNPSETRQPPQTLHFQARAQGGKVRCARADSRQRLRDRTAAADPARVIPSCVIGSAVAGALSMAFECTLRAPHGGIFVVPTIGNPLMYLLAIAIGAVVSMILLAILKKPLNK